MHEAEASGLISDCLRFETSEFLKISLLFPFPIILIWLRDHINRIKHCSACYPWLNTHRLGCTYRRCRLSFDIPYYVYRNAVFLLKSTLDILLQEYVAIIVAFMSAWKLGIINGLQRSRIRGAILSLEAIC